MSKYDEEIGDKVHWEQFAEAALLSIEAAKHAPNKEMAALYLATAQVYATLSNQGRQ